MCCIILIAGESFFKLSLQPSIALSNYKTGLLSNSPKMVVMMELIDRSVQLGDRVLVFRCVGVYVCVCVCACVHACTHVDHTHRPSFAPHCAHATCSQSLSTLSYVEKLLAQHFIPIPHSTNLGGAVQYSTNKWTKGKNYCRKSWRRGGEEEGRRGGGGRGGGRRGEGRRGEGRRGGGREVRKRLGVAC